MSDALCFVSVLCFSCILCFSTFIILVSGPIANQYMVPVLWGFMVLGMPPLVCIIFQIWKKIRSKAKSNACLAIPVSLQQQQQQQRHQRQLQRQQHEWHQPRQQEVPNVYVYATVRNDLPDYNELNAERRIPSAPTEPPTYFSLSDNAHEIV